MNYELGIKNKTWYNLATIISYVFFPVWVLPISISLLLKQIDPASAWIVLFLVVVFVLLPVMLLLLFLIKSGEIKNWDIQQRQNRYLINIFALLCGILLLLLLRDWGMIAQFEIFAVFLFVAAILTVITFFWKISVHAASITVLALVLENYFWGRQIWPLFLIPLVGWARIYRKNHTLGEVIGGISLSIVTIYLVKMLKIF